MPQHLAIIMDGNGRWAQSRGLSRKDGHKRGAEVLRTITQYCAQNVCTQFLTLYAFSTENWNRPTIEITFLMHLLEDYLESETQTYLQNNIRFQTIGDLSKFSQRLNDKIAQLKRASENGTRLTQILALNYGSRDEIVRAANKLACAQIPITQDSLNNALDTAQFPNVDMLIRTGGERRLSNFLLWQSHYAELFFSDTLWPDFTTHELQQLLESFEQRTRRFGGL
ncbi:MAG: di-trans,poly-cis-decaprenylcistransferase [Helicobacter sp.]|nr:di-trans,poly-cis-decaprenylcistransferase [Helicobacter sp.]